MKNHQPKKFQCKTSEDNKQWSPQGIYYGDNLQEAWSVFAAHSSVVVTVQNPEKELSLVESVRYNAQEKKLELYTFYGIMKEIPRSYTDENDED